jgi:hypothetical protein
MSNETKEVIIGSLQFTLVSENLYEVKALENIDLHETFIPKGVVGGKFDKESIPETDNVWVDKGVTVLESCLKNTIVSANENASCNIIATTMENVQCTFNPFIAKFSAIENSLIQNSRIYCNFLEVLESQLRNISITDGPSRRVVIHKVVTQEGYSHKWNVREEFRLINCNFKQSSNITSAHVTDSNFHKYAHITSATCLGVIAEDYFDAKPFSLITSSKFEGEVTIKKNATVKRVTVEGGILFPENCRVVAETLEVDSKILFASMPVGEYGNLHYNVTITPNNIRIGCQCHSFKEWMDMSDDDIDMMDDEALEWWWTYKPVIRAMYEAIK